jgi:hypothetical protein
MASQWSFGAEDDYYSTHSSPLPHNVYLPVAPSLESTSFTGDFMPPLPAGYLFLDDLNDTSDLDIATAYESMEGPGASSRQTSISSHSSLSDLLTMFTITPAVPTFSFPPTP